jgi:RNA polymerase sigma-70 factor (ECF subfamily)
MTVKEYNQAVAEFADPVYRFIRGNIKDEHRSDDIVQDSFEKLWMHVAEIEFKVVKSWLFTTAHNTMIDIIRKEKKIASIESLEYKDMYYESGYSDLNEILEKALQRLPGNQRTAIMLRDYEGYSYKEIGEITGQTESVVKINIYRGRIALKNFIGKIESILEQ